MSIRKRLRKKYHSWLYVLPLMALILMAMSWFATPSQAQQATVEENTTHTVTYSDANELNTIEYAAPQEFTPEQMANLCFAISDGYFDETGDEHKDSRANDTLAFLDRVTGQTTPVDGNVPNIEQTFNIEGMAFPPGAGVLYAANQGYLGTVDLTTGDHSAVQNDAQGEAVHFGTGHGYRANSGSQLRSENFNDVDSLSFDVITGVLWGVDRSGSRPDMLFQIDPTTGLHIPDVFPDPYNPGQFVDYVQVEPQNGLGDIDDIASHPITGELFAIMNQGGGPSMLVKINKQTGATTVIGWYTRHNTGEVISDFEGLSFFNDGKLYGSTGKDFNDLNVLWQIDTETAVATAVGEFTDRMIDVEALGCLTAPAFVAIEKSTNGVDADKEPGVYVNEGEPVVWDYFVRNTGGKVLYNVEVRDDKEGSICTIPQLEVGQSNVDAGVTCQASDVSVYADRPYGNVATVTGNDQADGSGTTYTDSDPSHYYSYRPAAVGNYVWRDTNGNGVQDAFETGVRNATVELYDSGGTLVGTTTTNENGFYLFDDLQPGTYSLKFLTPAGYTGLTQQNNGNDETDSDANPSTGETATFSLASGQLDLTWDAGVTGVGPDASLGDYVWEDSNANGIQDAGEPGIQGATVTLYKIGGTEIGTTTTDANGKYSFTGLEPSDYFVVFNQVSGYQFTTANVALDNAVDSDADIDYQDDPTRRRTSLITLNAGDNDITWDAGFYRLGSVGDTIWKDDDLDGVKDAGESGIAGITVILKDANGNVVANATTDANGNYSFTNLIPGTYTVVVDDSTLPAGYGQTYDLDGTLDHETTFALASGENKDDVDFGYVPATASLGDLVWNDTDADGVQDAGELGIEGVTVTLHKASDDSVVGTTTTAADGSYAFTNLPAGQYYLVFTKPSGFAVSPQDSTTNGGTDSNDSDIDAATGKTATITLTEGQNDDTWDAGFNQVGSIGDTIWSDTDGDGEQDAGEPGIAGVTVTLTDGNGAVVGTTTTDTDGRYVFEGLQPGDYTVTVTGLPTDVRQTYDLDGTLDDKATVTLGALENRNDVDFGYQPLGTINGTVWQDNDTDGTIDSGEPNLGGITVTLVDDQGTTIATTVTNPDGTYTFTNVPPGDYTVKVDPTTVPAGMGQTFDPDGTLDHSTPISVTPGQTVDNINFGYVPGASVGDFVWNDTNRDGVQDSGEAGISGVTVKLYNSNDELVGTTTTDANGAYSFTDLIPGDYYLVFDKPATYFASPADQQSDDTKDSDADPLNGKTATFSLTAGQDDTTRDAGFYQIPNDSSVGDFVWQDNDGDGVQDNGEPGIGGVTVILLDNNGSEVGRTTTDGNGAYLFDNIPDGTYTVKVDQATLPANLAPTYDLDGTANPDHEATFALGVNEDKTDVDFGYQPRGTIGDTIWNDLDGNGVQDPGEDGISGVTVTITDSNGNPVATVTTDSNGNYSVPNLPAGEYTITITPPAGMIPTFDLDGGNDSTTTITLTPGQTNNDVDFGYVQPASLGDFVWNDADADGTQDAGETGIENVTVELFDNNNQLVGTTTTAADGSYSFTNLLPGDYVLHFDHSSTALNSMIASPANTDADDSKDSDPDANTGKTGTINLSAGENDITWDAGFYPAGSIGDTIWLDTDGNGSQNNGEAGLANVTVTLTDANGTVIATAKTDGDGKYLFENLPPGDYTVTVDSSTLPAGVQQTGDPDSTMDHKSTVTLTVGQNNLDQDFGYQTSAPSISLDTTVYAGHDSGVSCTGVEKVVGANGDSVTYCYKVTNTGNTPLSNITLDDPNLGITQTDMTPVSSNPTTLQPGESVVYYYQTTITQDVVNTATVKGTDPSNTEVTDTDPAEVDLVAPAIDIQTTVYPGHNGGTTCPGSELVLGGNGDAVTYCFVVTNTGDTHLDNVTVTDPSVGGGITLTSGSPLAPGESVTLFYDGNINGDLTNTATATGNPTAPNGDDLPGLNDPTDTDPAQVDEVVASIQIENTVYAGHDGGVSCVGTELVSGNSNDPVTYCFVITNNGDTPLADIQLTDPELGVVSKVDGILMPGQSVTVHYEGTIQGDLVNTANVVGNPVDSNGADLPTLSDVTDSDPSEVKDTTPIVPNIKLETTVYEGHDGGASCSGSELVTGIKGTEVTYCYKVTNTGNTHLNDITITDPDTGATHTQNVLLAPGETFTLSFQTTINGDLTNTATATGNPVDENGADMPDQSDPSDTDPAEVNELTPAIQINNTVYEGHDGGSSCEGSELVTGVPGTEVTYCFKITNTGETHLDEVVLTNPDLGITMTVPISGTLAPGASVTVTHEGTIINDLVNNATVTGNPVDASGNDIPGAENPNDSDTSEVDKVLEQKPNINVEKTVYVGHDSGASCPGTERAAATNSTNLTFCFKVTNTGNTYLNNVSVSDPTLGVNLTHSGILAPNESVTLHAEATVTGDVTNTATATGNPVDENGTDLPDVSDPTDDDTANVDQIAPSIDIQTTVYPGHNGGASCPGTENVAGHNGDQVTYCFVVTNNGDTHLGTITVTDPNLNITINVPVPLAPGASTTVYYDGTINGDLTNTATATGNPTDENGLDLPDVNDVTDTDPASVTENACITSIGDTLWLDLDGDGLKSDNEPGISGATVNLVGAGPDGTFSTADDITNITAQTTNNNGQYLFTGLSAGKYQVDVDESTLPANYALTTGNEPAVVTVSECEENKQVNFGYTASVCQRGVMYGVEDDNSFNSQIFKLDLGTKVAEPIGPLHLAHDIEALEIHPTTGTMYAIAGGGGTEDGKLYTVDKETGALTTIGTANANDPDEIVGVAFDQKGVLWAFRENQGLMNVNLNTGEVVTASNTVTSGNWEGLAWDTDGNYLYGSEQRNLYRWDPDTDTTTQVCGTDFLPYPTEALDFRFDGKMMGGSDKTGDTSLSIFEIDIDSCQILPTDYDIAYTDVESLTSETCVESGEVDGNVVSQGRSPQALEGIDVTVMGDLNGDGQFAFSAVAKTDSTGKYEFANLPNGQYKLTVDGSSEEVEFTLTDGLDYQTPATISSTAEGSSGSSTIFMPLIIN